MRIIRPLHQRYAVCSALPRHLRWNVEIDIDAPRVRECCAVFLTVDWERPAAALLSRQSWSALRVKLESGLLPKLSPYGRRYGRDLR